MALWLTRPENITEILLGIILGIVGSYTFKNGFRVLGVRYSNHVIFGISGNKTSSLQPMPQSIEPDSVKIHANP